MPPSGSRAWAVRTASGRRGQRHPDGATPHELRLEVPLLPVLTMRPFTITVALLLGLAVAVNALAAWDRGRHEARLRAASASFRTGQAVLGYRNMDERRFQRARLESIPTPRVVTFGSSRVMEISTALAGVAPGAFYNAGMSAATVEDF